MDRVWLLWDGEGDLLGAFATLELGKEALVLAGEYYDDPLLDDEPVYSSLDGWTRYTRPTV